jgi:hypothetical protein
MTDTDPTRAVFEASNVVADDLFDELFAKAEAASDPDLGVELRWVLYELWAHLTVKLAGMGFADLPEDATDIVSDDGGIEG